MTDKEKAIVMAHTGICMLTGHKFQIFHKYVEDIMGRPIMTHEIGFLADAIKEKSKDDFIALCVDESGSEKTNNSEAKIDCDNADCNNCVNHKYCDYESNKLEIPTGSIHCQHTDAEISKSFIEDVESVKEQLPCGDQMDFPNTFDEFAKDYGFKDEDEVYTNGLELIPVFRVKQWLEHISTTKNDLAVDAVSRADARSLICNTDIKYHMSGMSRKVFKDLYNGMDELPSVTPKSDDINEVLNKVFEAIDDCNSDGLTGIFCSYDDGERLKEYIKNKIKSEVEK